MGRPANQCVTIIIDSYALYDLAVIQEVDHATPREPRCLSSVDDGVRNSCPPGLAEESKFGTPKGDEGTRIFKATEHPFYSGEFRLKGDRAFLIGSMGDTTPWDHLDYAGKHLNAVRGTIEIEVNEHTNQGRVVAEFVEGADQYRVMLDRFAAKAPFQSGGVATRIYEHGDSNNGDPLYPKTWLYLGGWGTATMYKNDQVLYKDYDAHFMVMERSRDPKTHEVHYPVKRTMPGGETDPAGMEIDLWVRSKEQNTNNFPPFETFVHLCWEEVTCAKDEYISSTASFDYHPVASCAGSWVRT